MRFPMLILLCFASIPRLSATAADWIYRNAAEQLSLAIPEDFEELPPALRDMLKGAEPDGVAIHSSQVLAAFRRIGTQFPVIVVKRFEPAPSLTTAAQMPNMRRSDGTTSEYFAVDLLKVAIEPNRNNWYFDSSGRCLLCLSEISVPQQPRLRVINAGFLGKASVLQVNWFVPAEDFAGELPVFAATVASVKWTEPHRSAYEGSPLDHRQNLRNLYGTAGLLAAAVAIVMLRSNLKKRRVRRTADVQGATPGPDAPRE